MVFIPHTPSGELRKQLQEEEYKLAKVLGTRRVKFVERGGRSLQSILCVSNPWGKRHCGRKCPMCDNGDLGKCRKESVVYEIKCVVCEKVGKRRVYVGETGKSGWERAAQHWEGWRNKSPKSCLHKHDANANVFVFGRNEGKTAWVLAFLLGHIIVSNKTIKSFTQMTVISWHNKFSLISWMSGSLAAGSTAYRP